MDSPRTALTATTVRDDACDHPEVRQLSLSPSFTLTITGLEIRGHPLFAEWERVGRTLFDLGTGTAWALGDWLLYGEGRGDWGETYTQAVDLTKRSYGSLAQCVRVSRAFNFEARFKNLSWSHHQAVLGRPPDERHALLQRAEAEQWNRDDLREHLREERAATLVSQVRMALVSGIRKGVDMTQTHPTLRPTNQRATCDYPTCVAVAVEGSLYCAVHRVAGRDATTITTLAGRRPPRAKRRADDATAALWLPLE